MKLDNSVSNVTVIYDGECDFCRECVKWVQKRAQVTALPFQSTDLSRFGLTYDRCSKEVVVLLEKEVFGGAAAVSELLKITGHKLLGVLLKLSGPLGSFGYRWVATHREGKLVSFATDFLRVKNRTN